MEIIKTKNYNGKIFANRTSKAVEVSQKWDVIVNHITEGLMPGTLEWLTNPVPEVSTHFLVCRDGKIYQQADLKHGAWHAVKKFPSSEVVSSRTVAPNLYTVSIEHEGKHEHTGGKLTEAQYEASLLVHKHIILEYEKTFNEPFPIDRDHIIGHYEVDTVNRSVTDPGMLFPWKTLLYDLTEWDRQRKELQQDPVNGPYINEKGERLWFRAIAGSYPTRNQAMDEIKKMKDHGNERAWLQAVYVKEK